MAILASPQSSFAGNSQTISEVPGSGFCVVPIPRPAGSRIASWKWPHKKQKKNKRSLTVVAAAGDVSADSITYLFVGTGIVALFGAAFPVFLARKDLCPECDGAGFIRMSGGGH